ncbi:MAG: HAD hydrolase-like protein [Paracoccaceae bacterium]|nr:HAD hydrolase-like protein [Paracoccaceae bacterium]
MPAIFIDLDGTLIDPKEGITRSIQHALRELGADVPSMNDLTWCIGPPLWESLPTLLGPHGDVQAAIDLYRERFTDVGLYEADVYDGIGEMLMDLRETGLPLYVATSKPHSYAQTIIEHFGISHYVDGLFGSELDGTRADKTSLLAHALAETGADPHGSVMIGDRRHDVLGAQNNDIPSLGVLWGYGEPDELRLAEADALAGAPEEAGEIVTDLLGLGVG